jgi:hypothetical protein
MAGATCFVATAPGRSESAVDHGCQPEWYSPGFATLPPRHDCSDCTASSSGTGPAGIRKHLRDNHAVGLNPVIRAIKELVRLGLVQPSGVTPERACKLYRLTPMGRRILNQLQS